LVVSVTGSIVTVKIGGNWMEWHFRCGYAILSLLLFRIVWGFIGSRYARFVHFLPKPSRILGSARGLWSTTGYSGPGHSPLGGVAVLALLAAFIFQAVTGLFSNDDIASEGPLAFRISKSRSDFISDLHSSNAVVIYVLLGLHVLAIAYYYWRQGRNLVGPMITGSATPPAGGTSDPERWIGIQDDVALWIRALLVLAGCAGIVWFVVATVPPRLAG
jgi:cytochrome b